MERQGSVPWEVFDGTKDGSSSKGEDGYVGVIHRLDQPVEGIVLFAKTEEAAANLSKQLQRHQMKKHYLAIVTRGQFPARDVLEDYMVKDSRAGKAKVVDKDDPRAKVARLSYEMIEECGNEKLLDITLETGRFHQIRAQMAHFGHPLAGDTKYGTAKQNQGLPFFGQALYAYKLTFRFTNEAGVLQYLNGRSFRVEGVPFLEFFRKLPQGGK